MNNEIYPKAYKELYVVLNNVPKENYDKIPKDVINMLEEKMDKNYEFKLKPNIEFEKQELLRQTKVLLAIIYRDYWATDNEKQKIISKFKKDIQQEEIKKQKEYNPREIFKNKKEKLEKDDNAVPAKVEKQSIITRIFNKIKVIFK